MNLNKAEKTVGPVGSLLNAPIYRRIEDDLRGRIRQGLWPVGSRLPSRKELAREYDVDLTTLQRAIGALLDDGTLRAEVPRGTFVAKAVPALQAEEVVAVVEAGSQSKTAPPYLRQNTRIVATLGIACYMDTDIRNWESAIVGVLERTFAEAGGTTRALNLHAISPQQAARDLLAEGVDALALISVYDRPGVNEDFLSAVNVARTPVVIVCWEDLEYPIPHVFYDNRYAGYQAADHLIACGYRPLVFVAPFAAPWSEERIAGALRASQCLGSEVAPLEILRGDPTPSFDADWAPVALELGNAFFKRAFTGVPGIIAANDGVAAFVLQAAEAAGKKAGVDFGLVGFNDDIPQRGLGITTLRPPLEDLGREAARNLLRLLQGERIPVQIRLQSQLIPRASTVLLSRERP